MDKTLDHIDRRILRVLQREGRIANVDLAGRVHLSPAACWARVRALEESGVIRGYRAELDPARLDAGLLAFVEVTLERTSPEGFRAFKESVQRLPQVLECHMVAGGFDYLIKARIGDMAAYRSFLEDALVRLPGVRGTHTYVVMEEVKNTREIAIADPS